MTKYRLTNSPQIDNIIDLALEEDIGSGDITTDSIIPAKAEKKVYLAAKADGIIAGIDIFIKVFERLGGEIVYEILKEDGSTVKKGDRILNMTGNYRTLLTGERTALNFLQRMSGIATAASEFVEALRGTGVTILDTRKTVPGHRLLDKYAVAAGGGENHRIGLFDMAMIKDNHIKVAGNITKAVKMVKEKSGGKVKIEVETTTLEEVKEALAAEPDVIMLDNMDANMMREAVKLIDGRCKTEASGNMTMEKLKETAKTGIDYISSGALTHSVKALDISMRFI